MQEFSLYLRQHLDALVTTLEAAMYEKISPLTIEAWRTSEPEPFSRRTAGKHLKLSIGDSWGGLFDCAWFHFTGSVPSSARGAKVVCCIDINGEMCVVDRKGTPVRGLTNAASTFASSLGRPGKRIMPIADPAHGGEKIDLWADAGCNDLFGELKENGTIREAHIAVCHEQVRQLYYDVEVLLDLMKNSPAESSEARRIETALFDVAELVGSSGPRQTAQTARELLASFFVRTGTAHRC